jgi:hypothetical protein
LAEDQLGKNFLITAKKKAADVLGQPHVGDDVKEIIKDLLQVANSFQEVAVNSSSQSADVRVLKKRFDQAKAENRASEAKLESAKQLMMAVAKDAEVVVVETLSIAKRHQAPETDPDLISSSKIKAAARKIIEAIVKINAMPGAPPEKPDIL